MLKKSSLYLKPFLEKLERQFDKRLVRNLYDIFLAIITHRELHMGLLLSELGGYVCSFEKAPAGTKRISNLLRGRKWAHSLIDDFLFGRAKKRIKELEAKGKRPLLLRGTLAILRPFFLTFANERSFVRVFSKKNCTICRSFIR